MGNLLRPISIIMAAALMALSAQSVHAGDRVALVVGNGKYVHATALPNPSNDARDVANVLREIGFDVAEGRDLDRSGMERLLRDFLRRAQAARVALLFYAGHGMQVDGRNYLIPVDAKLETATDLGFETVELDKVLSHLEDASRATIIILDACRDNPLARRFALRLGPTRSTAVGSGLAAYSTLGTGTLIAFATAPGQVALDGEGANSPFTAGLVKHMRTPGLELRQLLTRVRAEVAASTRNRQIPWDNSSLLGEVYLTQAPAQQVASPAMTPVQVPKPPPPAPGPVARHDAARQSSPTFIFQDSDRRYLTRDELRSLSAEQLRIARNEIFARRGHQFRDPVLLEYFSRFPWYTPRSGNVSLSAIEEANVKLIQSMER
jgi:hypothetical protein